MFAFNMSWQARGPPGTQSKRNAQRSPSHKHSPVQQSPWTEDFRKPHARHASARGELPTVCKRLQARGLFHASWKSSLDSSSYKVLQANLAKCRRSFFGGSAQASKNDHQHSASLQSLVHISTCTSVLSKPDITSCQIRQTLPKEAYKVLKARCTAQISRQSSPCSQVSKLKVLLHENLALESLVPWARKVHEKIELQLCRRLARLSALVC